MVILWILWSIWFVVTLLWIWAGLILITKSVGISIGEGQAKIILMGVFFLFISSMNILTFLEFKDSPFKVFCIILTIFVINNIINRRYSTKVTR